MLMNMTTASKKSTRRRGRPRLDETGGEELREAIIGATSQVYAEHGFHGTTVELILKTANVSRPTFYKLFDDRRSIIEIVVERANRTLVEHVLQSVGDLSNPVQMMKASIDAYFRWCADMGTLVGPIYNEINDPASPASEQRARIIGDLASLFVVQEQKLGLSPADPLLYDGLLRAIEHIGSSAFWPKRLSEKEIVRRHSVALDLALSVIQGERNREVQTGELQNTEKEKP